MTKDLINVAESLMMHAKCRPTATAFKTLCGPAARARFQDISYAEFSQRVKTLGAALQKVGIRPSCRTLVMAPMGEVFVRSIYALFALGAVPICIDPGIGRKKFLECIKHISPSALVGSPKALMLARWLGGRVFKAIQTRCAVQTAPGPNMAADIELNYAAPDTLGAIVFTSGSTGAPKAVPYTRGQMLAQVALLQATYGFGPEDTDLPLLSAFSLFNPALGSTTVVPSLDPRRPAATLKPAQLWTTLCTAGVTRSFGSPRLWSLVAEYALAKKFINSHMRQIHLAGAPVPSTLVESLMHIFPEAGIHTPYGATEVLPVSTLEGSEIIASHLGDHDKNTLGICVGRVLDSMQVKIILPKEGRMHSTHLDQELPANMIGEIVVKGPTVSGSYVGNIKATEHAKVCTNEGTWHRMGDLGFKDTRGLLWFCGRVVERVSQAEMHWDTQPVEAILGLHPQVAQAALIGFGPKGKQTPAVAVSLKQSLLWPHKRVKLYEQLNDLARSHPYTQGIHTFFIVSDMPVDARHNAKIHRLALARTLQSRWKRRTN